MKGAGGAPANRTAIYARLMFREFQLSYADIAELTDYQIASMLLCERDEHGGKIDGVVATEDNFRDAVYDVWLLRDPSLTPEQLAEKYEAVYG